MINLNNKKFVSIDNTENGEVSGDTVFEYFQEGKIVWADYSGGSIVKGHLVAVMDERGCLDMRYHHINNQNKIMTGICRSKPEILTDGRIRFYEEWQWTTGDTSHGRSIVEGTQG